MKKFDKHGEIPPPIVKADFTGGLNTANQVDAIAENQLADVLNMEIDFATKKLQTVSGTKDILTAENIFAAIYDSINNLILVVKTDKNIFLADFDGNISTSTIGTLSGNLYPKYSAWENGVLIASGGRLQYFDGGNLILLDSPNADEVFIRGGRVCISNGTNIFQSGKGDENFWTVDDNVDSSSKFVKVGYKDGGNFIGLENLSQNILVVKDNRRAYRLSGEFPQWQVDEIGKNFECNGRRSICKVGDDVFILGENEAYLIENNFYGNFQPQNLAEQVVSEIHKLPKNSPVKFISPLYQVWILGKDGFVLVFDLRLKSWWKRKFNSEILDVFTVGDEIFLVKENKICKLDKGTFKDDGKFMAWKFLSQRLVGHHDLFLKRSRISVTPLDPAIYSGNIFVGKVKIPLPIPDRTIKIFENKMPIFGNATRISLAGRFRGYLLPQPPNEEIFRSKKIFSDNRQKLFANNTLESISRNVFRNKFLDVGGQGHGGRFILQSIILDVVEV